MHSKSFDTRTAASVALSQIFSLVPLWQPLKGKDDLSPDASTSAIAIPEFPSFSVQELVQKGTLLLASSGKEFIKPTGILSSSSEVKKARKEAMGRLGLDFLDSVGGADEMDIEKELVEAEADVDMELKREDSVAPKSPMDVDPVKKEAPPDRQMSSTPAQDPSPTGSTGPSAAAGDLGGLSARERNRLKRKRKPGNSAFVAAPPPTANGAKYNTAPAGPNKYVYNSFLVYRSI